MILKKVQFLSLYIGHHMRISIASAFMEVKTKCQWQESTDKSWQDSTDEKKEEVLKISPFFDRRYAAGQLLVNNKIAFNRQIAREYTVA